MPDIRKIPRRRNCQTRLGELRLQAGYTQEELAQIAGVSRAAIWEIEAGRGRPTLATLSALAGALRADPMELMQPAKAPGPDPEELTRAAAVPGVSWDRANRRWQANITVNGKRRKLGTFAKLDAAIAARTAAEAQYGHPKRGRSSC